MNRRQALARMLFGMSAGAGMLASPALAQPTGSRNPSTVPGQQPATDQRPRVQMQMATNPEVVQLLNDWERYTRGIRKLKGNFERYVYDSTYFIEKRALGKFFYEAPDKGRIDLSPAPVDKLPKDPQTGKHYNPYKRGPQESDPFYEVRPETATRWVCLGHVLLSIDDENKQYESAEIPAHMRGKNITASPLPFLFGTSAELMQQKYYVGLGAMHDPTGTKRGRPVIHVVATPRLQAIAREWSRAEVLLDPGTHFKDENQEPVYVPTAIKLLDPTGNQESVYVFSLNDMQLNQDRLFFENLRDPFKNLGLAGYTHLNHHQLSADPRESQQRTAESPGRATVPETR